jgi:hypothetical protein
VTYDLFVWASPRDIDADLAEELVAGWLDAGGDPERAPFPAHTDIGWFHRELIVEWPDLEVSSDAAPNPSTRPVWLSTTDEPPARVVAIRLPPNPPGDLIDTIYGLAMKYDLPVFDRVHHVVDRPLEQAAAYESATFWPWGAIRAAVAGGVGLLIAVVAWALSIPILSGLAIVVGGFLFVTAVFTFIHDAYGRIRRVRG